MKNQTMFDNPNRPMDLQLFAEQDIRDFDDPGLATDVAALFNTDAGTEQVAEPITPAPTAPTGATVPPVNPNPPQTEPSPAEPPQTLEGGQPVPGPQTQEQLIGGKFKSQDELLNAYTNLEAMATRKAQEAAQYKSIAEQMQKQQTQSQNPVNQQISQEPSDDGTVDPLTDSESLTELLYSDPAKVIQMILDRSKQQTDSSLAPINQEREEQARQNDWRGRVDAFQSTHPDTVEWSADMSQILTENPQLRDQENGLEIAYNAARGQKYAPPQQVDPTSYLKDENFVNQNIINNPEIKNRVIRQYLSELQNGGTPVTIGGQAAGNSPMSPKSRPQSFDEADAEAEAYLRKL